QQGRPLKRLLQQRRRRDVGVAAYAVDDERDLIDVAPAPVFAGFERADDRVRRRVGMRGRVPVRRGVAAPDVTAHEADPEVQPLGAHLKAFLAPVDRRRELVHGDLVEMAADAVAHFTSSTAGVRERWPWTNWTAIAPSPTAVAHRFVDPERTSPAAKTPGTSVSSMFSVPAAA